MPPRFESSSREGPGSLVSAAEPRAPGRVTLTQRLARAGAAPAPASSASGPHRLDRVAAAVQRRQQDHDLAASLGFLGGPAPSIDASFVQLSADAHTGLSDDAIGAYAAHGVSGGGGALPHLDAIQRAFGPHDVTGVTAHVGGAAADASHAIGAHAYATGSHVAFAQAPDLFLAAHEAAHVVQQRQGVHLSSAVGEAGDRYERHADEVAAAVVRGDSAAELLGAPASAGGAAVQREAKDKPGTKTIWMPGATHATSWYLDYDAIAGTSTNKPPARSKDTAAVLDKLVLQPDGGPAPAATLHGGNWAASGAVHIGDAELPRGPTTAHGEISYPSKKAVKVSVLIGGKPASKAAHGAALAGIKAAMKPAEEGVAPEGELAALEAVGAAAARATVGATAGDVVVTVTPSGDKAPRTHVLPSTAPFEVDGAGRFEVDVAVTTKERSVSHGSSSGTEDDDRTSAGAAASVGTAATVTLTQEEATRLERSWALTLGAEVQKVWAKAVNTVNLTDTHALVTTREERLLTEAIGVGGPKGTLATASPPSTGILARVLGTPRKILSWGVDLVRGGMDAVGLTANITHTGMDGTDTTAGTIKTTGTETTISEETALSFAAELTTGLTTSWETRKSTALALSGNVEAGTSAGSEHGHKETKSSMTSTTSIIYDTITPVMAVRARSKK